MKLVSPVLKKEMFALARRKRHYFIRAAFLAFLLIAIGFSWMEIKRAMRWYGFRDMSYAGRQLFSLFDWCQSWAVMLLMPALAAPVVALEKERKTLGLLLMSNLTPVNVLLDKLLSRMALVIVLILSGIPLFLACLAFGGVTPGEILNVYVEILSFMLFSCAVGIYFSTISEKTVSAMISTYAVCGIVAYFQTTLRGNTPVAAEYWTRSVMTLLAGLLAFVLSVMYCARLLPRVAERGKRSVLRRMFKRMNAFFHSINFTGVVLMDESRALKKDAMYWKEAHKSFFSSPAFMLRSFYTFLILSIISFIILSAFGADLVDSSLYISTGGMIFACIIGLTASASAFSSEREKDSLEVLLSTPVTARAVVLAKFAGVLRAMTPSIGISAVSLLVSTMMSTRFYSIFGEYLFMLRLFAGYLPLLLVIGLYSSSKRRSVIGAMTQTVLVYAAIQFLLTLSILLMFKPYPALICNYLALPVVLVATYFSTGQQRIVKACLAMAVACVITLIFPDFIPWLLNKAKDASIIINMENFFRRRWYTNPYGESWLSELLTNVAIWSVMLIVFIRRFDKIVGRV